MSSPTRVAIVTGAAKGTGAAVAHRLAHDGTSGLGNRGQTNYSAAKAGIEGFTKTRAIELGRVGITVNVGVPGFIAADMLDTTAALTGVGYDDFLAAGAALLPVYRAGTAEDPAHAVSLFVGEDASYVSGQALYVAGGPFG